MDRKNSNRRSRNSTAQPGCALDRGARRLYRRDQAEIERVEEKIAAKKAHINAAAGLFKSAQKDPRSKERLRSSPAPPAASARASRRRWRTPARTCAQRLRRRRRIERQRAALRGRRRVEVAYHPPTCPSRRTSPTWSRARRSGSAARHPGQQCRHPARRAGGAVPDDKWDAILAINLSSAFHATKAALPQMRRASGAASSTSPRRTAWSPRPRSRPTCQPSMGL